MRNAFRILVCEPVGKRDHFGDLGADGRIILKSVMKESSVRMWAVFSCAVYRPLVGPGEHGHEPVMVNVSLLLFRVILNI
jgi:hypothetical protein